MTAVQTPTPLDHQASSARASSTRRAILVVVLVLVLAAVGAVGWFLSREAPAAVDIEAATSQVAENSAADQADPATTTTTTTDAGIEGTWMVDTSIGTFSVAESTGVFVGFRVAEELAQIGAVEAVGRTGDVSGTVTIEGTTLTAGEITADVTTMVSNDRRREDDIAEALESATHPTATFTVTQPVELGSDLSDGQVVDVDVIGTLTIHGVSQQVSVPMQVVRQDDVVVVTGSTGIAFADYGVDTPSSQIVVSLDDAGTLELQLFLTLQG